MAWDITYHCCTQQISSMQITRNLRHKCNFIEFSKIEIQSLWNSFIMKIKSFDSLFLVVCNSRAFKSWFWNLSFKSSCLMKLLEKLEWGTVTWSQTEMNSWLFMLKGFLSVFFIHRFVFQIFTFDEVVLKAWMKVDGLISNWNN